MQKVARNEKICSKYTRSCQKIAEQLVESPRDESSNFTQNYDQDSEHCKHDGV